VSVEAKARYTQLTKLLETDVETRSLTTTAHRVAYLNLLKAWDELSPRERDCTRKYEGAGIEVPACG